MEDRLERDRKMSGFPEKILLATDGLVSTGAAVRAAADLAEKGGAELHVVHVWTMVSSPHAGSFIRSGLKEIGQDRLDEQVKWIEAAGGAIAEASLIEGRSVEGIIAHAEETGAGLVVVGSRGMGRLGRMVIGSVSTGLVHRSPCPVLIVPEGEEVWPPERVIAHRHLLDAPPGCRWARNSRDAAGS
ncbi:MAG: universal stress protein [Rubrobacter sp.]